MNRGVTRSSSVKTYHENTKNLHYCAVVKGIYPHKARNKACHDMVTLPALLAFCEGNSADGSDFLVDKVMNAELR